MRRITITAILFFALFVPVTIAQNTGKRQHDSSDAVVIGAGGQNVLKRQPKPLTTDGLVESLAKLAGKAQSQGMTREAEAIRSIIPAILTGTPADRQTKTKP